MLQAKTGAQKAHIGRTYAHTDIMYATDDGVFVDGFLYFDNMAEIVDYLRSFGEKEPQEKMERDGQ